MSRLPFDPQRRCNVCGNLFSKMDWEVAYVGEVPGEEQFAVIHEDCFIAVWNKRFPTRAILFGATSVVEGWGI